MATIKKASQVPTWHGEIKDYFTAGDVQCMLGVRGIDLANYSSVVSHAPDIYQRVADGSMPMGGPRWAKDKVGSFLAWMAGGYPQGEPQRLLKLAAAPIAGRVRKSLATLNTTEVEKLKTAFNGIMALDIDDRKSYFQQAAIHGLPLAFCQHHDPGFLPWHRVQMTAFEDALRSVNGCEDITLPYWDFNELLPEWIYQAPFGSYTLPADIGQATGKEKPQYKKGYKTVRNDAAAIMKGFNVPTEGTSVTVMQCIANALDEVWWDNFNGLLDGTPNLDFIMAHDGGHDATGDTMGQQNVSAFDPIFWFYHCNLDRLWWIWQINHNAQTLEDFTKTIENKESLSYRVFTNSAIGRINPWADYKKQDSLTAAFTVDLFKNFDVSYDNTAVKLPHAFAKEHLSLNAARSFAANDKEVNVRVKDVNRTKIPGSFKVHLLKDGERISSVWFFQPDEVEKCANCMQTPIVHFDFRLPLEAVKGGTLSINVEPRDKEMYGATVPNKVLGNPRISVSLLMDAS